jgi:hypothetical protein
VQKLQTPSPVVGMEMPMCASKVLPPHHPTASLRDGPVLVA